MNTPGYNCRLVLFFARDKRGKKIAYRWSGSQMRAFRISLVEAENFLAQGQADKIDNHPLKEVSHE